MIFTKCWGHKVNLLVRHVLAGREFADIAKCASSCANAITSESNNAFFALLRCRVVSVYGPNAASSVFTMDKGCWHSLQGSFASMLRIQHACEAFAIEHEHSPNFPAILNRWRDAAYWAQLTHAELLIRPFCEASFLMNRVSINVAHVVLIVLNLYTHIRGLNGGLLETSEKAILLHQIEAQWMSEEHPLYFLAFALHPKYSKFAIKLISFSADRIGNWYTDRNPLSVHRVVQAAEFYYRKHELIMATTPERESRELERLKKELQDWMMGRISDLLPYDSSYSHPVEWWSLNRTEFPELSQLATFLLCASAQTSSCESLFVDYVSLYVDGPRRHSRKRYKNSLIK